MSMARRFRVQPEGLLFTTPCFCRKPIRMQPSFQLKSIQQSSHQQVFSSVVLYATGKLILAADGNMLRVSFLHYPAVEAVHLPLSYR